MSTPETNNGKVSPQPERLKLSDTSLKELKERIKVLHQSLVEQESTNVVGTAIAETRNLVIGPKCEPLASVDVFTVTQDIHALESLRLRGNLPKKGERFSLMHSYRLSAQKGRLRMLSAIEELRNTSGYTEKENLRRRITFLHQHVALQETMSKHLGTYVRLMEKYWNYRTKYLQNGNQINSSQKTLERQAISHFVRVRLLSEKLTEALSALALIPKGSTERAAKNKEIRMLRDEIDRTLACEEANPNAGHEIEAGDWPVHKLFQSLLHQEEVNIHEELEQKADVDELADATERKKAFAALRKRLAANTDNGMEIETLIANSLVYRAGVASYRQQYGAPLEDDGLESLDENKLLKEFDLQNRDKDLQNVAEANLQNISKSMNDLLDDAEKQRTETGVSFVAKLSRRLALLRTQHYPNDRIPGISHIRRMMSASYERSVYDIVGWPTENGKPIPEDKLTAAQIAEVERKVKDLDLQKIYGDFADADETTNYKETVSVMQALHAKQKESDNWREEDIWDVDPTTTLKLGRVTAESIQSGAHANLPLPILTVLCYQQFKADTTSYMFHKKKLFNDINKVFGFHYEFLAEERTDDLLQKQSERWFNTTVESLAIGATSFAVYRVCTGRWFPKWMSRGGGGAADDLASTLAKGGRGAAAIEKGAATGARSLVPGWWKGASPVQRKIWYGGMALQAFAVYQDAVALQEAQEFRKEAELDIRKKLDKLSQGKDRLFTKDTDGVYWYTKGGANVSFTIKDFGTGINETAAGWHLGTGATALAAMIVMGPKVFAGPVGWGLIAIEVVVHTGIDVWQNSQYYDFVRNCPPWLLVLLGGTGGTIGAPEEDLLNTKFVDLFLQKEMALKEKTMFSLFIKVLAVEHPDLFAEITGGLNSPDMLQELYDEDFKRVVLPFFKVQLFTSMLRADLPWDKLKKFEFDEALYDLVEPKEIHSALSNSAKFYMQHHREKMYLQAKADMDRSKNSTERSAMALRVYELGSEIVFNRRLMDVYEDLKKNIDESGNGRIITRAELLGNRFYRKIDEKCKANKDRSSRKWHELMWSENPNRKHKMSGNDQYRVEFVETCKFTGRPWSEGGKPVLVYGNDDIFTRNRDFYIDLYFGKPPVHGMYRASYSNDPESLNRPIWFNSFESLRRDKRVVPPIVRRAVPDLQSKIFPVPIELRDSVSILVAARKKLEKKYDEVRALQEQLLAKQILVKKYEEENLLKKVFLKEKPDDKKEKECRQQAAELTNKLGFEYSIYMANLMACENETRALIAHYEQSKSITTGNTEYHNKWGYSPIKNAHLDQGLTQSVYDELPQKPFIMRSDHYVALEGDGKPPTEDVDRDTELIEQLASYPILMGNVAQFRPERLVATHVSVDRRKNESDSRSWHPDIRGFPTKTVYASYLVTFVYSHNPKDPNPKDFSYIQLGAKLVLRWKHGRKYETRLEIGAPKQLNYQQEPNENFDKGIMSQRAENYRVKNAELIRESSAAYRMYRNLHFSFESKGKLVQINPDTWAKLEVSHQYGAPQYDYILIRWDKYNKKWEKTSLFLPFKLEEKIFSYENKQRMHSASYRELGQDPASVLAITPEDIKLANELWREIELHGTVSKYRPPIVLQSSTTPESFNKQKDVIPMGPEAQKFHISISGLDDLQKYAGVTIDEKVVTTIRNNLRPIFNNLTKNNSAIRDRFYLYWAHGLREFNGKWNEDFSEGDTVSVSTLRHTILDAAQKTDAFSEGMFNYDPQLTKSIGALEQEHLKVVDPSRPTYETVSITPITDPTFSAVQKHFNPKWTAETAKKLDALMEKEFKNIASKNTGHGDAIRKMYFAIFANRLNKTPEADRTNSLLFTELADTAREVEGRYAQDHDGYDIKGFVDAMHRIRRSVPSDPYVPYVPQ